MIGFPLPVNNTYSRETKSVKFNAYVDDSLIFSQTEDSVWETFKLTSKFENASGAKIHKNKTTGRFIGPLKGQSLEFKKIALTNKYKKKTVRYFTLLSYRRKRSMDGKGNENKKLYSSLEIKGFKGKILIIKTFLISQIGFQLEMNHTPQNKFKAIDKLIWEFLWDGKQPLVNRQTMFLNTDMGGMNMLNLTHFIQAKHVKFIYNILKTENKNWNAIGKNWLKTLEQKFGLEYFACKYSPLKKLTINFPSNFYQDALSSWAFFISKLKTTDRNSILNEYWYRNNKICFKKSPLLYFADRE